MALPSRRHLRPLLLTATNNNNPSFRNLAAAALWSLSSSSSVCEAISSSSFAGCKSEKEEEEHGVVERNFGGSGSGAAFSRQIFFESSSLPSSSAVAAAAGFSQQQRQHADEKSATISNSNRGGAFQEWLLLLRRPSPPAPFPPPRRWAATPSHWISVIGASGESTPPHLLHRWRQFQGSSSSRRLHTQQASCMMDLRARQNIGGATSSRPGGRGGGKGSRIIRNWQLSFSRSHVGHSHSHGGPDKSGKAGEQVLGLGLWGDVALAIGKGGAGFVSGSTALIADAAHSVSDIALSGVALWTSKVAHSPKDKQHPYGHGKFESVGALGISGILLLTGGGIAWAALDTLQPFVPMLSEWASNATEATQHHGHGDVHGEGGHHHGIDLQHPYVALTAAVCSIGVKEILYWRTKRVGEEQNSELLKASAWHHRSDAVSSIVALLGVGGSIWGLPLLDPIAGIVVSGMIAKAGFETGYQSLQDLVDSGVPEAVLSPIRGTVSHVQGVEGCHHLRARRMGSFLHVDAHIEVDPWLSVSAAHSIGEAVRQQVQKDHPEVAEAFVHIEPADGGAKTLTHQEAEHEHEHRHHSDHKGESSHEQHQDESGDENSFTKKDMTTSDGSKSDIIQGGGLTAEAHLDDSIGSDARQHSDVEQDVRQVVEAQFHETMSINHVTSHFLPGQVIVEVEVSMNPDISVRDAMDCANDAEKAILQRVSDISKVRLQLKLSKDGSS